jgi:membrane protease YdiL (CAAX protease family)
MIRSVVATPDRGQLAARAGALLLGAASAALARAAVNGQGAVSGFAAGAAFGAALLGLAVAARWQVRVPPPRALAIGLAGGAVLIGVPLIAHPGLPLMVGMRPQPMAAWIVVTVVVATAEEVVFRGALLDAVSQAAGLPVAIGVTSLAFALIHVPLYGWGVVPLDLGVGIWLAGLRLLSGSVAAPAVAHVLADLATWWL